MRNFAGGGNRHGFLFRRRASKNSSYYFIHPDLLDPKADNCIFKQARGEYGDDPQLQFYIPRAFPPLLCPNTSDGCDVSPQWALRKATWHVNVVDKFQTLCDVKNGAWAGTATPLPREDSDDFPSVVATRFGHILEISRVSVTPGLRRTFRSTHCCVVPIPTAPPSLFAFSHTATPVLCNSTQTNQSRRCVLCSPTPRTLRACAHRD